MDKRYQRDNQNPYIKEGQTIQWTKDTNGIIRIRISKKDRQYNGQKKRTKGHTTMYKTLSTTHFSFMRQKTKDRVTRAPLKTGNELRCSGRVSSSCSTCVNLVTTPLKSHEWGNDRKIITTNGTYPWSFVTHIFRKGQPNRGFDRKTFEVVITT